MEKRTHECSIREARSATPPVCVLFVLCMVCMLEQAKTAHPCSRQTWKQGATMKVLRHAAQQKEKRHFAAARIVHQFVQQGGEIH